MITFYRQSFAARGVFARLYLGVPLNFLNNVLTNFPYCSQINKKVNAPPNSPS